MTSLGGVTESSHWDKASEESIKQIEDASFHPIEYLWGVLDPIMPRGGTCFEFGCVPGKGLRLFAERYDLVPNGVDFSKWVFVLEKYCKTRWPSSRFWNADIKDFKISETFDVVLSQGFLEHFSDWQSVLKIHVECLKENGILVLNTPNLSPFRVLYWKIFDPENLARHVPASTNLYNTAEELKKNGCEIIYDGYYGKSDFWYETKWPWYKEIFRMGIRVVLIISGRIIRYPKVFWSPSVVWIARKKSTQQG